MGLTSEIEIQSALVPRSEDLSTEPNNLLISII